MLESIRPCDLFSLNVAALGKALECHHLHKRHTSTTLQPPPLMLRDCLDTDVACCLCATLPLSHLQQSSPQPSQIAPWERTWGANRTIKVVYFLVSWQIDVHTTSVVALGMKAQSCRIGVSRSISPGLSKSQQNFLRTYSVLSSQRPVHIYERHSFISEACAPGKEVLMQYGFSLPERASLGL